MDTYTIEQCRNQLNGLTQMLSGLNGKEADQMILETCASLIGAVEKGTALDSMGETQLRSLIENYKTIYYVMHSFMEKAANVIPLDAETKAFMQSQTLYDERRKSYEAEKEKSKKLQGDISTIETEMQTIYATNGLLFKQFEEQKQHLLHLQELEKTFDENALDILEKEVHDLAERTDELKEREAVINRMTAECLGELSVTLQNIGETAKANLEEVTACKQDADEFRKVVKVCEETYENYRNWFDVNQTPWKQLEAYVGASEYEKLRGACSEEKLKQKNELVHRIETDLKSFETLVASCTRAAQNDYERVRVDAGK